MKISPSPFAAFAGLSAIAMLVVSCGANKAPKTVESTPVPLTTCEVTLPATTDLEEQAPQKIVFEENHALHSDAEKADGFQIRILNRNNGGKTFNFTLPIDDRLEGLVFSTANSSSVTASLVGHQLGTVKTVTGDVVNIGQLKNEKLRVFEENGRFLGAFPIICSGGR
jgi:hypothetical protein